MFFIFYFIFNLMFFIFYFIFKLFYILFFTKDSLYSEKCLLENKNLFLQFDLNHV